MTTENYRNIKEWGIFATACLVIVYLILNILFHNFWTKGALSGWIFIGPMLILSYVGFFISMYLISGEELPDESDKAEIRERCTGLKASVAGFIIWLIILFILDRIQVQVNIFLSIFCGYALSLVIFRLLKRFNERAG